MEKKIIDVISNIISKRQGILPKTLQFIFQMKEILEVCWCHKKSLELRLPRMKTPQS